MNDRLAALAQAANSPIDLGWWLARTPYKRGEEPYVPTPSDLHAVYPRTEDVRVAMAAYERFLEPEPEPEPEALKLTGLGAELQAELEAMLKEWAE